MIYFRYFLIIGNAMRNANNGNGEEDVSVGVLSTGSLVVGSLVVGSYHLLCNWYWGFSEPQLTDLLHT